MLLSRVVAYQQHCRRIKYVAHARSRLGLSRQSCGKSGEVGGAMMVDIIGLQNDTRELLQQITFFVGSSVRAHDADGLSALMVASISEAFSDQLESFFPCGWSEAAILANERLSDAIIVMREIECVAALDAKEIAVDTALVAIISAHDLHTGIGTTDAQSSFASITAMGASRANVLHLPGTRFVAIRARGQRAHGADVDAHAALFALEMIFL